VSFGKRGESVFAKFAGKRASRILRKTREKQLHLILWKGGEKVKRATNLEQGKKLAETRGASVCRHAENPIASRWGKEEKKEKARALGFGNRL